MQVTVGLRKFWQEFDASQTVALPYCGFYCAPDGNLNGATSEANSADFDDQLLKINFSYDIDDNTMVYATWSEGFRHGGANSFPTSGFAGVDTSFLVFQPDEATNIEFGVKGSIGDTTRYSFAAYRIDWENAQLDVYAGALGIPGVVNGDEARSQGLELEVNTIMGENLTVDLGLGYTDAEVTTDAGLLNFTDFVTARKGDPLPGVPDVQASLALNYLQPLSSGDLRYNLTASYRSSAETNFNEDFGNYANLDAFAKINASVTWQRDAVAVTGYVKNLTDEAGLTGVQNGRAAYSHIGFVGRPRTVGIRLSYDF
jgi:outer membrane receptor protein involved in Fe transport